MGGRPAIAGGQRGGWCDDPAGRFEHRFWDGTAWTAWVSDHEELAVDLETDFSRLEPPAIACGRRAAGRFATTIAGIALAVSVVAYVIVRSGRGTGRTGGTLATQVSTTLVIEYVAMAGIALGGAALLLGVIGWIGNHRRGTPSKVEVCATVGGAIALGIAVIVLTGI